MAEQFPAPPVRTPFWDPANPKTISRPWINWFQQLGMTVGDITSGSGGGGGGTGAAVSFDKLTSGENVQAAMKVGTGASITPNGGGVIDATEINGIPITGMLTHAGQIPISQPGNASAVWSDPLVQGIQAEGTTAATVMPVLVAGKGADGNLHDLSTDNSGNLNVNLPGLANPLPVSVSNFPSVQPVSGTVTIEDNSQVNIQDSVGEILISTDGSLNVHLKTQEIFNTDGSGNLGVNIQGTPTVTANQGAANATPWNENLALVGGNAVVTGGESGALGVGGLAPTSTPFAGNPVMVGGLNQNNNVYALWSGSAGQISSSPTATIFVDSDGLPNTINVPQDLLNQYNISEVDHPHVFNGTTWDRLRSGTGTGSVKADIDGSQAIDLLKQVLAELRYQNLILASSFNSMLGTSLETSDSVTSTLVQ